MPKPPIQNVTDLLGVIGSGVAGYLLGRLLGGFALPVLALLVVGWSCCAISGRGQSQ